jgi:TrmH family RNA methyltransferase
VLTRADERRFRRLSSRRHREADGAFLAEGVRVIEELLDAGIVLRHALISSSLEDTERGQRLAARLAAAAETGVVGRLDRVTPGELGRVSPVETSQGVLAMAELPERGLAEVGWAGRRVALVLDGVQDPGNLGTLVRSAVAFGCGPVVCLPGTVDPWNPKSVRASAGTVFRVPVAKAEVDELEGWLGTESAAFLGADAAGRPVERGGGGGQVALAVGNEGAGLGSSVRSLVNELVAVPMAGAAESLNVAVAAGILMYELTREPG